MAVVRLVELPEVAVAIRAGQGDILVIHGGTAEGGAHVEILPVQEDHEAELKGRVVTAAHETAGL